MHKNFVLKAEQLKRYLPDIGYGFVTDMVTVEGKSVDYMVRQVPDDDKPDDSGWIFYGGGEDQDYMDSPDNISLMALNTIANYDTDIIEFLTYPYGTEVERNSDGKLEVINQNAEKPDVVFMYPAEKGFVQVTKYFGFEVKTRLLKRFDRGSLVLWKPEFTIWLTAYDVHDKSIQTQKEDALKLMSAEATDIRWGTITEGEKLFYLLEETEEGGIQKSANIKVWSETESVFMSIYYDSDEFLQDIELI